MLMELFGRPFVGTGDWDDKLATARTITDVLSTSDEAFVILMLENYWRYVVALNNITGGEYDPRFLKTNPDIVIMPSPRYTYIARKGSLHQQRGWSRAGICRYNDLFDHVTAERLKHPTVDAEWLINAKLKTGKTKKRKLVDSIPLVRTDWDLDQTDDEDAASEDEDVPPCNVTTLDDSSSDDDDDTYP